VLLRYLPGGVWQWVGRATEYKAVTSVPARVIVLANFSEWGLLLLVALALYLFTGVGFAGPHWGQMGLGALALASALGLGIRWQPKSRSRRLRLAESVLWIACYGVAWFLGGAIVYLWVRYSGSQLLEWSQAIRIWTLTGGIGFISSLVAGLMIREITLTWLLQPYLPVASGLLVALLIRVLFTLADVLWAGAGWALSRYFLSGRGRFGSNFVEMEQLQ
jgi:hypothetical protein